jgi:2-alkyl-3-oxoalkanoate reductase
MAKLVGVEDRVQLARPVAGEHAVAMMCEVRGASNAKAKRELEWTPRWPTWREGFTALAR